MAAQELSSTTLFNDANLVDYYKMENVNDSKGANNWTNNGTVAFNAAKFNNGANNSTPSSSQYLSVASALGYTGGAYSISFWVKMQTDISGTDNIRFVVVKHATSKTYLQIGYFMNGTTKTLFIDRTTPGTAGTTEIDVAQTLGTSTFHNIVLTYDGTTLLFYLDNVQIGNLNTSGNGTTVFTDASYIFANINASGNAAAACLIDDVSFFTRKLTTSDIDLIYNGPALTGMNQNRAFFMN